MKKSQHINKALRELNSCIFLSRVLLFLYKESTIQVLGLMIAAFWSWVSCKITDTIIAAPLLFASIYLFVKYLWVPSFTKEDVEELQMDLNKFKKEREEIRIQLIQN